MTNHATSGLAGDSDFFDWLPSADPRFFLAPEVAIAHGYALRAPPPFPATWGEPLPAAYPSDKLPRSAS
jgi:hypothetical protein